MPFALLEGNAIHHGIKFALNKLNTLIRTERPGGRGEVGKKIRYSYFFFSSAFYSSRRCLQTSLDITQSPTKLGQTVWRQKLDDRNGDVCEARLDC